MHLHITSFRSFGTKINSESAENSLRICTNDETLISFIPIDAGRNPLETKTSNLARDHRARDSAAAW